MIKMKILHSFRLAMTLFILTGLWYGTAWGHAFPVRSEPGAGTVHNPAPVNVRIWFDVVLEPASCAIVVRDAKGTRVDKADGHVNPSDAKLLETNLPPLPPGTYRVLWNVMSKDGHKTSGDYTFIIK